MSRLLLITLGLSLFAVSGCIGKEPRSPASSNQRNPWWSASESQVETAACKQSLPKNDLALRKYFLDLEKEFLANNDGNTVFIEDLKLENQPGILVRSLYEMLRPGSVFNDKVKLITHPKKRFRIPDSCTAVACVAEKIFGTTVGLQMLYLKAQFELNTSPYSFDDSEIFTQDELWDFIKALELLPKNALPFTRNQKLTHYTRTMREGRVYANATMGYYTTWSDLEPLLRQYIAFHEFAHNYAYSFADNLSQVDAWLEVSGWEKSAQNRREFSRVNNDSSDVISKYAKTNPSEDFAETVAAYRLNSHELKSISPKRYNFVRDFVFDGIEFTHPEGCQRKPFFQKQIEQGIINSKLFSPEAIAEIVKQCQPEYVAMRFGHLPNSYYSNCVQSEGLLNYFKTVEMRPIPRTLLNDHFARSAVSIRGLEERVTRAIHVLLAKSIWKTVDFASPFHDCRARPWTTLQDTLINKDGVVFTRKPLSFDAYKASPQKTELACRELIRKVPPNELLSEGSILSYLNQSN